MTLPRSAASGAPLHELIAAVKFQELATLSKPATSSAWLARSYYLQSRSELPAALTAARRATELAPDFGFAWARVAELEFGFEHRQAAQETLRRARQLSPRNAQAVALAGFIRLDENHPAAALASFDQALALDGALPTAWLGHALAHAQFGDHAAARRDLQTAAALEPQRGLFRSYLGKAWSQSGQDKLAANEFGRAQKLDPADPTAWLYSALHRHQTHQINDAVRDLERSMALNDNRSVFRSRLQLDRDRATRSADLAAIYDAAGLTEVGERAASRAVQESYSDFAGHLFLAQSLQGREDPQRFDLRFETARESELLVANLLAPPACSAASPRRVPRPWCSTSSLTKAARDLADAMRANGHVVLAAELSRSSRDTQQVEGITSRQLALPASAFTAAAAWGVANARVDDDFVVRQHFHGVLNQNQPSLVLATARLLGLAPAISSAPQWIRYYGGRSRCRM